MSKRLFFIFFSVFSYIALAEEVSPKASPEEVKAYVQSLGGQVVEIVNSDWVKEEKSTQMAHLMEQHLLMDRIARAVVGRYWRSMSAEEKKEYMELVLPFTTQRFSMVSTAKKVESLEVLRVHGRASRSYSYWIASVRVRPLEGEILNFDLKLIEMETEEGIEFKILDLALEGVSMASLVRDEFTSVIDTKGVPGLLVLLREKINK